MTLPDYHLHSRFSCDSQSPMSEYCQEALAQGLTEIGFADHYDRMPQDSGYDFFQLEPWAVALEDCRSQFAGQLTLRAGIEISEPHRYPAETQALLVQYPFDYVLGSLHWVGAECALEPAYFARPATEAYRRYFEELEKMTRAGGFDILGHFDVVARLGYEVYGEYAPRLYAEEIRAALRNCIERGIALELNTSTMARRLRQVMPGLEILRWYVELGGERVTLGSDAHHPRRLAGDFATALENLRTVGLKYVTQFEQRQARALALP